MKRHLRNEKDCLNCGAEVTDRFCPHCGQENVVTKETFRELVADFFADITHYDSKFFSTIKDLLFKPGFLTRQYFEGRRTKYLNPLRMYFFISFIFFFVLFLKKDDEQINTQAYNDAYISTLKQHLADSLRNSIKLNSSRDTMKANFINSLALALDTANVKKDTSENIGFKLNEKGIDVSLIANKYISVQEYNAAQLALPPGKRDKGFIRWVIKRNIELNNKYGNRSQLMVAESFEHSIPKLMFFLLPLFAWFIYMLHSRKKYYYAQHAIFSIHFHSFNFLLLLVAQLLSYIPYVNHANTIIALVVYITEFIYLVLALKNAYQQPAWASVLKAMVASLLYIFTLIIGLLCLMIISFVFA